jgi:hypothetical protein
MPAGRSWRMATGIIGWGVAEPSWEMEGNVACGTFPLRFRLFHTASTPLAFASRGPLYISRASSSRSLAVGINLSKPVCALHSYLLYARELNDVKEWAGPAPAAARRPARSYCM